MKLKLKILVFFVSLGLYTQSTQSQVLEIKEGATLTIDHPSSAEYQFIKFPRKNFIIKRGAIADLKSVYGKTVEVVNVSYTDEGDTKVTLKRTDGQKFFRHYKTVDALLENALNSGELRM